VSAAVPIRFPFGQHPTMGRLSTFGDWTRFVRSVFLGLRGADLDLRLTRLGDMTLLDGFIVDRIAPGSLSSGVPGLSIARSPLSFFGSARTEDMAAQALVDDVVDPHVIGAALEAPILDPQLRVGAAAATDQASAVAAGRRALNAMQASARYDLFEEPSWSAALSASLGGMRALSVTGLGAEMSGNLEHRFGGSQASVRVRMHGGFLGPHFLENVLGPTYLVSRADQLSAIGGLGLRGVFGADLLLIYGRLSFGFSYADGIGVRRDPLDRQISLSIGVEGIRVGGTRLFDLRLAYASRGLFTSLGQFAEQVLHSGARLRFNSWLFAELYLERGVDLEGGAGLTVLFTP
jgi:hypothetical protein